MKPKTGKPLVVTKIQFSPSKDAGCRLRRVYELLLSERVGDKKETPPPSDNSDGAAPEDEESDGITPLGVSPHTPLYNRSRCRNRSRSRKSASKVTPKVT